MKKLTALLFFLFGCFFAACASPKANPAANQTLQTGEDTQTSPAQTETPSVETTFSDTDANTDTDKKTISEKKEAELLRYEDAVPIVYMTKEITGKSMLRLYESLYIELDGARTAVYVSAEDPMGSTDLEPALLDPIVPSLNGTIAVCATADDGSVSGKDRYSQAREHGLTQIADVVVLDEHGSVSLFVEEGVHLQETKVGAHFSEYDGYLVISNFTSHPKTGFRGAVSSLSLGFSSAEGKRLIHSAKAAAAKAAAQQDVLLESMAEAGKSISDALDKNLLYINVMNHFQAEDTVMPDIGILACTDPVALDQACVDLVYMAENSAPFINAIESQNGEYLLEHAEEIGLGNSAYTLITIE